MKRRLGTVALVVATAILTSLAHSVIAGPPPPVTGTGTDLNRVKVVGTTGGQATNSTTFVDLTGASANIKVDAGQTALIVARFGATSFCTIAQFDICIVRILIGGVEADPASLSPFDSVPFCGASSGTCSAGDSGEAHSLERWRTVGPGTYAIEVEFKTGSGASFTLANWTLEVDRIIV